MRANFTFQRALISLSHPISIGAIVLLLFNDHVWRRIAPSWFTGKIGDFAWLIFAPFTLPALLIAWWIWEQSGRRSVHWPKRGRILLLLAVLATMANSCSALPYKEGIICLGTVGSAITTSNELAMHNFVSRDGGLTWQIDDNRAVHTSCNREASQWRISNPSDERNQYRFTPGVSIERSSDGGQSWTGDFDLNGDDARNSYVTNRLNPQPAGPYDAVIHLPTGNVVAAMGGEGVLVRTSDGIWHWIAVGEYHRPDLTRVDNVVALLAGEVLYALVLFALTLGTLARRRGLLRMLDLIAMVVLELGWARLIYEFFFGLVTALFSWGLVLLVALMVGTCLAFIASPRRAQTLRSWLICAAWLGWLATVVLFPPAKVGSSIFGVIGLIALTPFAVLMVVGQVDALVRSNRRALLRTTLIAVLAAALYLLPYVVWSQGGIPFYGTAMLYALVLVATTLIAGRLYLRRFLNEPSTLVDNINVPASP